MVKYNKNTFIEIDEKLALCKDLEYMNELQYNGCNILKVNS